MFIAGVYLFGSVLNHPLRSWLRDSPLGVQIKEEQISGTMGDKGGDFSFGYIFCAHW